MTEPAHDRYPIPWTCENGHVLGLVVKHNGITRLQVLRQAMPAEDYNEYSAVNLVGMIAELTGTADWIKCTICGAERTWSVSEEGMTQLLSRRKNAINKVEKLTEGIP